MATNGQVVELELWNMIGANADLRDIIASLIGFVEAQLTAFHAVVYLLHESDAHLRLAAPWALSSGSDSPLDRPPLSSFVDASLAAAIRAEGIFIEDLAAARTNVGDAPSSDAHGVRAAWAVPLMAGTSSLGTMIVYGAQAGLPSGQQREFLDKCARIAALAACNNRRHVLLDAREYQLRCIYDNVSDVLFSIAVIGNREFRFESANRRFFEATGLAADQVIGLSVEQVIPEPSLSLVRRRYEQAMRERRTVQWEEITAYPAGLKTGEVSITPAFDSHGTCTHLVGSVRDITEHKFLQSRLARTSHLYAALSQCNQAIVQCETEQQLFEAVCGASVTFGGMQFAWIGLHEEATGLLRPTAWHGIGSEYIESIEVSVDANEPTGIGPGGTAYREQRPVWCQDFLSEPRLAAWRSRGIRAGWNAMAALPLNCEDKPIGVFFLYSGVRDSFDEEVRHLLTEMAMDISFGITKIRARRERAEERKLLQVLSRVVEQSHNMVMISDASARITYVNPAFQRVTGYSSSDVIGCSTRLLMSPQTPRSTYAELRSRLAERESWHGEFINVKKDGTELICLAHVSPLRSTDGTVSNYVSVGQDITEQRKSEWRVEYLTHFDALTGLPNRAHLRRRFDSEIGAPPRAGKKVTLISVDLDYFRFVNDTDDHLCGDNLIREISRRLQETIGDDGVACRLGGDEFAVMLPDVGALQAPSAARRILAAIALPHGSTSESVTVTASLGVAIYPEDGADFEALFRNSELAMYRAKIDGRGCFRLYTEALHTRTKRTTQLVNKMRRAISNGDFELHYQPQFTANRLIGAETLLRWNDPALGTVFPSEFIPIAEESGLIVAIDNWVLGAAVRQAKEWRDAGMDSLVVGVNVSPAQFRSEGFYENVVRVLESIGLPPQNLEIEITEGAAMQDPENAVAVVEKLFGLGVRMAIDDFGIGYSSLGYLKRFKVHRLKIDKSFVRDLATNQEDRVIVATIISMARHMGLESLAEGVETQAQWDYLVAQGCESVQGYLFSKPLPAAEFATFWNAWRNR